MNKMWDTKPEDKGTELKTDHWRDISNRCLGWTSNCVKTFDVCFWFLCPAEWLSRLLHKGLFICPEYSFSLHSSSAIYSTLTYALLCCSPSVSCSLACHQSNHVTVQLWDVGQINFVHPRVKEEMEKDRLVGHFPFFCTHSIDIIKSHFPKSMMSPV